MNAEIAALGITEEPYVPSTKKLAVIHDQLLSNCSALEQYPQDWGLDVIALFGPVNYGKKAIKWYHGAFRSCQITVFSDAYKIIDSDETEDPRAAEADDKFSRFNGRTIVSLDLSVNNISSIAAGTLGSFIYLRRLDISCNNLSSLEGLGAANNLRELNVSMNRLDGDGALKGKIAVGGQKAWGGLNILQSLASLDISYNSLRSLGVISKLINLTYLNVSSNKLNNLNGIMRLQKLKVLLIKNNRLSEITQTVEEATEISPRRFQTLPATLIRLDVSNNEIDELEKILKPLERAANALEGIAIWGNPFNMDGSHRWPILEQHPNLKMMDGQEVKGRLREQLENMHRRDDIMETLKQTKNSIESQLRHQEKRKDWNIRSLRTQEEQVESMFYKLQGKLEAEYEMAAAEIETILANRQGKISEDLVKKVKEMAENVGRRNEGHLMQFENQMPRGWDLPQGWERLDPNSLEKEQLTGLQARVMNMLGQLRNAGSGRTTVNQHRGGTSGNSQAQSGGGSPLPHTQLPEISQGRTLGGQSKAQMRLRAKFGAITAIRQLSVRPTEYQ